MSKFKFGDGVWHDNSLAVVHSLDDELNGIYKVIHQDNAEWVYASENRLTLATDWIPCSERMPEEDVDIWVWHKSYHKPLLAYYADELFIEIGSGDWLEVSHYHPLIAPAPPQD